MYHEDIMSWSIKRCARQAAAAPVGLIFFVLFSVPGNMPWTADDFTTLLHELIMSFQLAEAIRLCCRIQFYVWNSVCLLPTLENVHWETVACLSYAHVASKHLPAFNSRTQKHFCILHKLAGFGWYVFDCLWVCVLLALGSGLSEDHNNSHYRIL